MQQNVKSPVKHPFRALRRHLGGPRPFNRVINIDPAKGFVYLENPKVGCSTIKATLNLAIAARDGIELSYSRMDDIHDRALNPMLKPQRLGPDGFNAVMMSSETYRFTYVREPVRRFCSAYLAKIAAQNMGSNIARRFAEAIGWPLDRPMTLDQFADVVAQDDAHRDFDPHWRLQRDQVCYDLVQYDYVGQQDQFGTTFPQVLARLFPGQEVQPFDSRVEFDRHTASQKLSGELSADTRAKIERAYAADTEMLADVAQRFG